MIFGKKKSTYILEGLTHANKEKFAKALSAVPEIAVISIDVGRSTITVEAKGDPVDSIGLAARVAGITVRTKLIL
jgi:hypothetical protein